MKNKVKVFTCQAIRNLVRSTDYYFKEGVTILRVIFSSITEMQSMPRFEK